MSPFVASLRELLGPSDLGGTVARHLDTRKQLARAIAAYLEGELVPGLTEDRITQGLSHLLASLAKEQPLVALWEDLHFADAAGRDRFLALARMLRDHAVLFVATTRTEGMKAFLDDVRVSETLKEIELGGLESDACRLLADELLEGVAGRGGARRATRGSLRRQPAFPDGARTVVGG